MSHGTLLPFIHLATPAPAGGDGVIIAGTVEKIFEIPKNQIQMQLYYDYVKGTEPSITIQLAFEDINIPGEFFDESAKESLSTMRQIPLNHLLDVTSKHAVPFPVALRYARIRVRVTSAGGDGTLRLWLNPGNFVEDPLPDIMKKERPLGEGWELPN